MIATIESSFKMAPTFIGDFGPKKLDDRKSAESIDQLGIHKCFIAEKLRDHAILVI